MAVKKTEKKVEVKTEKGGKIKNGGNEEKEMKRVQKNKETNLESKTKGPADVEEKNQKEETEKGKDHKKEGKKGKEKPEKKVKKFEAIAKGENLPISKKQAVYICSFIKGKDIDIAIRDLERVRMFKEAVPFKGEIPHRRVISRPGRYPVKASGLFVKILKALKGNAVANGLELEKTKIECGSASWGRRPMKRKSRLGKRTNVLIKAREIGGKV